MPLPVKIHLLPGTMCNALIWQPLRDVLPDAVELVHLDIPNHLSPKDLAAHYLHITGDERLNLAGFSLGGYLAAYFACRFPEHIARLFIIANSPAQLPEQELAQRQTIVRQISQHGYAGLSRARAARMLDDGSCQKQHIDMMQQMDKELGETTLLSQYQYLSERDDLQSALCQQRFPCHFYYSEKDTLVNTSWLNQLVQQNTQVRLHETTGSGHMLPLEKPKELAMLLQQWLSGG